MSPSQLDEPVASAASSPGPGGVPPAEPPGPPRVEVATTPTATPAQLSWLDAQVRQWQDDGLVDEGTAAAIRGRYVAARRVTLVRVVLGLGAVFVVAGLVWLVLANLGRLGPLARFVLVAAIWLGVTVLAELLAARRTGEGDLASPVVGAARALAAGSVTAVVFQAAQSLDVPSYRASLLGCAALGALVYGYAVRSLAAVTVGIVGAAAWAMWEAGQDSGSIFGLAVGALLLGVAGAAAAVVHRRRWWPAAAWPWRVVGAAVTLVGMFFAAVPRGRFDPLGWSVSLTVGLVVAMALAAGALWVGDRADRLEALLPVAALAVGSGLSAWTTHGLGTESPGWPDGVHAVVAVVAYLLLATAYAVLGAVRDTTRLAGVATGAVVVFVTFQAFAVFAPIMSGSALFLTVGVILLVSGYLADRGRRRLVARVGEEGP